MNIIPTENPGLFVLIVLTVRPENQQALIDTIGSAGDPAAVPGLRSISLLRSLDGTQVINHMHWAGRAEFEEARAHLPVIEKTRAAAQQLVEHATTNLYEVAAHF
ncbi:antibiotic biosynthesis monooxygenase family protein [Nocardia sp. NBC_01327]|uniref:antibiotic biosynthesis monooxygenase family protein n=1 Tax=Nocardia sp. NBC_01327 TaxID=2903593 RepID=UPI002E0D0EA5|nr:antibiotic biosynthesis monooxygenase [Nocardia sp. NBC_01327]